MPLFDYDTVRNLRNSIHRFASRAGHRSDVKFVQDWAPSAMMVLHDDNFRSKIRFAPLSNLRKEDTRYSCEIRVYGQHPTKPIWIKKFDGLKLTDQIAVDSDLIAAETGLSTLNCYGEIFANTPDAPPHENNTVLVSYIHYTTRDGSFEAHQPSSYIYGAGRFTKKRDYNYENFPAVRVDAEYDTFSYTLNPFLRKAQYWLILVGADGETLEEGPFTIRAKSVARWDSSSIPRDRLKQPVGAIVKSDLKVGSFFGLLHKPTKKVVSFDHTHPFFSV
jgi:hypothetical protein